MNRSRFQSLLGEGVIAGQRVLLLKAADLHEPQRRGNARGALLVQTPGRTAHRPARRYQPAPGRIRVRAKGSDGGHNGLKSIIYQHGSDAFPRVKIGGVGMPPRPDYDMPDWVLGTF